MGIAVNGCSLTLRNVSSTRAWNEGASVPGLLRAQATGVPRRPQRGGALRVGGVLSKWMCLGGGWVLLAASAPVLVVADAASERWISARRHD